LDFYEVAELAAIVRQSAQRLEVDIDVDGATEVARRSRGTPRIANRLLRRVRDVAQVRGWASVDELGAREALTLFGVDEAGLDKVDRGILELLTGPFSGQAVGLTTLSQAVGEEPQTLEDAYEPFLLRQGFLQRTPRGRMATAQAYRHLGRLQPSGGLF
jgi:Holliday junction DNA helicase RuvB